jgi:hypothetical protein
MEIDGKTYRFQAFSVVAGGDGFGVEAWVDSPSPDVPRAIDDMVCEVFRADADESVVFTAFQKSIPFAVVEKICQMARERVLANVVVEG